ncbi:MAG: DinB family protein [Actinomycetota bacterium]|nr:DinB family protein [Actinomycetota bacterium]
MQPQRVDPPAAAPELVMLTAWLDFHRATLLRRLEGLDDVDLRRPLVPSGTSLLGIVKHLAYVERWWFCIVFAGQQLDVPWTDEDPDADWRIEPDDTTDEVITLYGREIARARTCIEGAGPDDVARYPNSQKTLRWVMAHMIEETARHNGHADIIRELIDGRTGE